MSSLPTVPPRPSRPTATSPPEASAAPALTVDTPTPSQDESKHIPSSPEQKIKIDPDLDLHHPMAVRPASEMPKAPQQDDIPEIGQRVPMLEFAGDVQAPHPAPDSRSASRAKRRSQHTPHLPAEDGPMVVGDYGAYPSGNKVYRQNGAYSLSHDDLTRSVMKADGLGVATTPGLEGVPDEEIGYLASDEITSRNNTPQVTPGGARLPTKSPLSTAVSALEGENDTTHQLPNLDEAGNDSHGIYGNITNASSTSLTIPTSGRHTPWEDFQDEHADGTPILASDEAGKYPARNPPAISPRLSAQEVRRPPSSNRSRHSPSIVPEDDISDPPSPVKEHAPLFPAGVPPRTPSRPKLDKQTSSQRFPSKDVWEDAPESSHATYEVQDQPEEKDDDYYDPREAKLKEEARLEEEAKKAAEAESKEATESGTTSAAPPIIPTRPTKRVPTDENSPVSPDSSKHAPIVPDRPKPSIPPRPSKKTSEPSSATTAGSSSPEDSRSPPPTKPKPMVPGRVGGGIAALRANFMNDLNSRLSKGPVAPPKKEEPEASAEAEPKEREPLEDVRKTRARGPAKRKPTTAAAAAGGEAAPAPHVPKLTFSSIITVYSIGDDYEVSFDETKFDDEPSKIARPMKGEEVPADTEAETVEEEKKETPVEEESTSTGPVDAIKDVAAKVVEAVAPSSTEAEESKPETSTEGSSITA
ncbi:hypothetical protein TWF694_011677 [Orbilia ellipsospora]|uniref:Altered inheritance of mitochondria protein 21 n=1 Tax=Orbilia ellipsospora TaxID=2528407 RepID=A0AAV9X740_9PEZI